MIKVKKYSATWCGPCKMLNPIWESQIKPNFPKLIFESIDVDMNEDDAQSHNVNSVPTVIVERDGKEVARLTGLQSVMTYKSVINESLK
jgi:thioredoxin 1